MYKTYNYTIILLFVIMGYKKKKKMRSGSAFFYVKRPKYKENEFERMTAWDQILASILAL